MSAVAIVGAQWGDEGKGKIVDHFAEAAHMVVRYGGGPNAGHTLVVGGETIVVRLVPSGVLRPAVTCVLGQGMAIDLRVLAGEIDALTARGLSVTGRLFIASRAHLVLPIHILVDTLRESGAAGAQKLGTTKRGIGPCYEDKAARRGLRAGDLSDPHRARAIVERMVSAWAPVVRALGGEPPRVDDELAALAGVSERLLPSVKDTSRIVDDAIRSGANVLLEGAQGTLLDLDHGTYPFVTSSTAVAGGACVGAGIGPTRIRRSVGITKAYTTRVGEGPFPTELHDAVGETIRKAGAEFGSVTGRPRRTGWLDLPGLRYAARVNGLDGLAITKLDVLSGLPEVRVCTGYELGGGTTDDLPIDQMADAKPVYATLAGWSEPLSGATRLDQLPAAARAFLDFVRERVELPFDLVSVGPGREQTIVRREPF